MKDMDFSKRPCSASRP